VAKKANPHPTYVVNGLVLKNGLPAGDFRGTWNWDGTPEGFFELQEQSARDLAKLHKMNEQQIRICITGFIPCTRDTRDDIPVNSRAC